jgi:polysaccharide biosynthesis/export protein
MRLTRVICPLFFLFILSCFGVCQPQLPAVGPEYIVGPEDVISVTTRDIAEASGEFLVRADGKITFPLIGEVEVSGKTVEQIRVMLTDLLKKELRDPEVFVNIRSMRPNPLNILGMVGSQGPKDYKPGWRLTDVIAASGGLRGLPERLRAVIWRHGQGTPQVVELRHIFLEVKENANVPVYPGDVVIVQGDATIRVNVVGEVPNPGERDLLEGYGAVEAVASSGYIRESAALSRAKIVRRGEEIPVDLNAAILLSIPDKNVPLQDGDTLYIPKHEDKIALMGMVGSPGAMPIPDGRQITLTQAIALAGGPRAEAKRDVVSVYRRDGEARVIATTHRYLDILVGKEPDVLLRDGDIVFVAQTGKPTTHTFAHYLGLFFSGARLLTFGF